MPDNDSYRDWQPRTGMAWPVFPFRFQTATQGNRGYQYFKIILQGARLARMTRIFQFYGLGSPPYDSILPWIWPKEVTISYLLILFHFIEL
jgi:hypothetical protein